jgi:hypothetical protein
MVVAVVLLAAAIVVAEPAQPDASSPVIARAMAGALGPLGEWIAADGGVPVSLGGGATLYLFGDTFAGPNDGEQMPAAWRFVHSSALLVEGERVNALIDLIGETEAGSFYWLGDAKQEADGSVTVVAHEMVKTDDSWLGFHTVDTDVFWVRDPRNVMSWRLADKRDDGWWDGHDVHFIDGHPSLAAVQPYDAGSWLYDIDAGTATPMNAPASDGLFVPVEFDGRWWGASWSMVMATTAIWSAPTPTGPWTWVADVEHDTDGMVYGSQLHVVDGELTLHWSNARADLSDHAVTSMRPTYLAIGDIAG